MRLEKKTAIKSRFSFEAPIMSAAIPAGLDTRSGIKGTMDLNRYLGNSGKDTFLVHVNGESMIEKSIFDGDLLIVEKNGVIADGKIVIASVDGELTCKIYREIGGKAWLYPANSKFEPIEIKELSDLVIQGVVKHVIHEMN